jgi:adenosylcobinamide-GDP ribazoletransferase
VREAVAFLTRLPVGGGPLSARAAPWFPLVGAAVGALVAGVAAGLAQVLPALLAATLAVAVEVVLTGALHLDGLADSADGLAGRDRERALAIMRDHALGTYGALAVLLDVLAKVVALAVLVEAGAVLPVVGAFAVARAAPLPLAAALPYPRAGAGVGRLLVGGLSARAAAGGVAVAAAVAVLAGAAPALACLALVAGAVGWLARRRLGGVTGDVLGAAVELTGTAALVVTVAVGELPSVA